MARGSFWLANEGELEYLYHDFKVRARQVKAELHPDRGGLTSDFQALSALCEAVQHAFNKRGIGLDPGLAYTRYRAFKASGTPKPKPRKPCRRSKPTRIGDMNEEQKKEARLKWNAAYKIYRDRNREKINERRRETRRLERRRAKEAKALAIAA